MKKYLLLAALLPLLAACKKNSGSGSTGGTYYMKFKLNGAQKSYATATGAAATSSQGGEAMVILLNSVDAFSDAEIHRH